MQVMCVDAAAIRLIAVGLVAVAPQYEPACGRSTRDARVFLVRDTDDMTVQCRIANRRGRKVGLPTV